MKDDCPEALSAARKLGILSSTFDDPSLAQNGFDSPGARSIRRRRSSAASDSLSRISGADVEEKRDIEVVQDGERVALRVSPEPGAVDSPPTGLPATDQSASRAGTATPTQAGQRNLEYIVVVALELDFGKLKLPRFATTVRAARATDPTDTDGGSAQITVPTPLCLRNTLVFDLPSPPPSSRSPTWDLSVRPSLSNTQSTSSPTIDGTRVSGTFPTSSSVSLRWAPQLPVTAAPLIIRHAALETRWSVDEFGAASAEVEVSGDFEYSGLREKQWVELEVGMPFVLASGSPLEIAGCTPSDAVTSVLDWEVVPAPTSAGPSHDSAHQFDLPLGTPPELPSLPPLVRQPTESGLSDSAASVSTSATACPFTPTPAPRRKRVPSRTSDPRPPSWTSLFDTAPPAPPVLDTSFSTESPSRALPGPRVVKEPSLLQQAAPFDPEASAMDMSFEVSSTPSTSSDLLDGRALPSVPLTSTRPDEQSASCLVRVQLDLGPALRSFAVLPTAASGDDLFPTFAFALSLHFSPAVLSASTRTNSPLRLFVPSITIPTACHEENIVSVSSSSADRLIELVSPPPVCPDATFDQREPPMSPLPASKGVIRWSTVRTDAVHIGAAPPPVLVDTPAATVSPAESDAAVAPSPLASDWTGAEADFAEGLAANAREEETTDLLEERPPSPPTVAQSPVDAEAPNVDTIAAGAVSYTVDDAPLAVVEVTVAPVPHASASSLQETYYEFRFTPPYTGIVTSERLSTNLTALAAWDEQGETCLTNDSFGMGELTGQRFRLSRAQRLVICALELGGAEQELPAILRLERGIVKLDVELFPPEGAYSLHSAMVVLLTIASRTGFIPAPRLDDGVYALRTSTRLIRFRIPAGASLGPFFLPKAAEKKDAVEPPAAPPVSTLPSLRTLLRHSLTILIALYVYHAFYPSAPPRRLDTNPHKRQATHPAVASPASSSAPAATSVLRTPHTVTTTATSTSTIVSFVTHTPASTQPVVSTITLYRTTTIRQITPVTPTAPLAFDDCLPPATSATVVPRTDGSLAQEDAQSLLASLQVWLERVKLDVRTVWRDLLATFGL